MQRIEEIVGGMSEKERVALRQVIEECRERETFIRETSAQNEQSLRSLVGRQKELTDALQRLQQVLETTVAKAGQVRQARPAAALFDRRFFHA